MQENMKKKLSLEFQCENNTVTKSRARGII